MSDNFDAIGFSSCYFLYNMGSLVLIMALQPVIVLIFTLILKFKGLNSKVKNYIEKMIKNLVWNGIIGMIHENYMLFTICVLINVDAYDGDWSKDMIANNVFVLIFIVFMVVFPIALAIYTWKNYDELLDEESELA